MERIRILVTFFIIFGLVSSSGCVKRNLHIASDPPGAIVYFNERDIGPTPLDYDFKYYAEHKIELKKEDCEPIRDFVSIRTPLYLWVPLDLILHLIPYEFWDRRELFYTLTPRKE